MGEILTLDGFLSITNLQLICFQFYCWGVQRDWDGLSYFHVKFILSEFKIASDVMILVLRFSAPNSLIFSSISLGTKLQKFVQINERSWRMRPKMVLSFTCFPH